MRPRASVLAAALLLAATVSLLLSQKPAATSKPSPADLEETLWQYRNLGKAFYENPTTQVEAVDQFAAALKLKPDSVRERLNYALALLRAGKNKEAVAELEAVQKKAPQLPHTYFNLGIYYKREGDAEKAIEQFRQMTKLVPDEPITHYNLGVLYKQSGDNAQALTEFERATGLSPALAAPHFQLYNAYRLAKRPEDAAREIAIFQQLKKLQEGAAVPEDMEWSDYAEIYDPLDATPADKIVPAKLTFRESKWNVTMDAATARLQAIKSGAAQHILLTSKQGATVATVTGTIVANEGLSQLKDFVSATVFDANNDGQQDLCIITKAGASLWRNKDGHFSKVSDLASGTFVQALALDFDHDYDLDLVLLGPDSKLLRNESEAGFADRTSMFPFIKANAVDGVVIRSVADSKGVDLVVTFSDHETVLYRDRLVGQFEATPLPLVSQGATDLRAADWDQDGGLDLFYRADGAVTALHNQRGVFTPLRTMKTPGGYALADLDRSGREYFLNGTQTIELRAPGNETPSAGIAAVLPIDLNSDGLIDLITVANDGAVQARTNTTITSNAWVRIDLLGVKNLMLAPYAEVEVKAGTLYQKRVFDGRPLTFGLRRHQRIDTVRITWPNSLIQNEMKQAVNKPLMYKEAQRLSGSCPMIYTWDGEKLNFITDVLGVAPLGAMSGDGQYFPTDHDEYVQIPGSLLKNDQGHYRLRITEELGEVSYLDQLQLLAVDHPADVEIFSNEKWKSPPYPEFRLFGVKQRIYPVGATDQAGHNMLPNVIRKDRRYADGFTRTFQNTAEPHYLELDFGHAAPSGNAVLILNGWVDWADGSTFLNRAQAGNYALQPPSLQMQDAQGRWITTIEDMGMPSGKTKTFAVDISGKWPSKSRKIRITTNMCVFWDEVFLGEDPGPPSVRVTKVPLVSAQLGFHGFSKSTIDPERKQPERFDYSPATFTSLWNPTPGNYTRYGDVRGLVSDADDRLSIMGSGDEVRLDYDAQAIAAVPAGWTRDFQLLVEGWAKDGDANTAYSQNVEPYPFHGMKTYPYSKGETYPARPELEAWRKEYNTRPGLKLIRPLSH